MEYRWKYFFYADDTADRQPAVKREVYTQLGHNGKGITHCRLPYGHVTLIAYYSITDRQPVVCCNWQRAN